MFSAFSSVLVRKGRTLCFNGSPGPWTCLVRSHQFWCAKDAHCALMGALVQGAIRAHLQCTHLFEVSPTFVAFETVPVLVSLTLVLSRPLKEAGGRFLFSRPSLLQAIDGVMSLALRQVVFQAPQHFISSKPGSTCVVF